MRVELDGGEVVDLGTTEAAPTISMIDYSRRVTDDFGVTTVVKRGFARRMAVRLGVAPADTDALQRRLASLRATSALWVADDRYANLSVHGFCKDFSTDVALAGLSLCTLTVEGLTESEPAADTGGDPAPVGRASTLRLLSPVTITTAMLTATNVAETDYPAWAPGTSYAAGARVIKAATHRIYESAVTGNLGNDPAGETGKWIDIGPTNRWAMFDEALGTVTSRASPIVMTIAPGAVAALAVLDVVGTTVRVQTTGEGGSVYDRTLAVGQTPVLFLDLPGAGAPITVIVSGTGTVSVGTFLVGALLPLGVTEASPAAGITDYSRKETDDFGEVTIVERAWAKRMTTRALIRSDAIDNVFARITAVRARPSLWIGEDQLDSLTLYGFFKDFSIEVGETVSTLALTVEGLSKAAPIADPAPPPFAWAGDWVEEANYHHNEIVRFGGRLFGSKADGNIGNQPPSSAADDAYWFLFADKGTNGTPGAPGANGQTSYVHIAYANAADGSSGFSTTVSAGKLYIGVYTDFIEADSTNPALYSWTRIKGEDGLTGATGTPGAPGTNGATTYFHVAYADNSTGTANFTTGDPGARTYIGVYTDFTAADSSNPAAYTWSKYVGADGANGTPGAPGANGQTSYVHFAWANAADGSSGFSTTDSVGKLYIGVYSDFTLADSINPALYSWSLIKGADGLDGAQGIPGTPGANGQTTYVHFAYADSADGTVNFTTGAAGGRYYIGVYTDFTAADSSNPAAYTWSLQRGADGSNGTPGAPGANGQPSYVHIAYANNASGTLDFSVSDPTGRTYIGVYTDFTLADSTNPASYTWSLIKGADGSPGAPGVSPIALDLSVYAMDVAADSNNVTKAGALPKGSVVSLTQAGGALTPSSVNFTYSDGGAGAFAADYGVVANTVRLTTANAPGWIDVNVVYAGLTYTKRIAISRTQDPQPPPSQTSAFTAVVGGDGAGATTYNGAGILSPELVLKANGAGQINAAASGEYYTDQPGASVRSLVVAMRIEIAPQSTGVFSAPLSESIGSQAFWDKTDATPGIVSTSGTFTGLTPDASYRIRVNTRKVSGSNPSVFINDGALSVSQ